MKVIRSYFMLALTLGILNTARASEYYYNKARGFITQHLNEHETVFALEDFFWYQPGLSQKEQDHLIELIVNETAHDIAQKKMASTKTRGPRLPFNFGSLTGDPLTGQAFDVVQQQVTSSIKQAVITDAVNKYVQAEMSKITPQQRWTLLYLLKWPVIHLAERLRGWYRTIDTYIEHGQYKKAEQLLEEKKKWINPHKYDELKRKISGRPEPVEDVPAAQLPGIFGFAF